MIIHLHQPDSPLAVMTLEHGLLLLDEGEQTPKLSHVDGAWEQCTECSVVFSGECLVSKKVQLNRTNIS